MRNSCFYAIVVTAALMATPFGATTQAAAPLSAPASIFGQNVIVNGGAELVTTGSTVQPGPGAKSPDSIPLVSPPGWQVSGTINEVQYGAENDVPGATSPGPAGHGTASNRNFFWGGPSSSANTNRDATGNLFSTAKQTVVLAMSAAAIDSGKAPFSLSAYLGGYSTQDDNAAVRITFLDGKGTVLSTASIGPVLAKDRPGSVTGLYARSTKGTVPAGARSVSVVLTMTRISGSDNDSSADDISLILTAPPASTGPVPTPTGTCTASGSTAISTTAPVNGARVVSGSSLGFAWQPAKCATAYYLQVWLRTAAPGPTSSANGVALTALRVTGTSYGLATNGWLKGLYAWRVIAVDSHGSIVGKWSAEKALTIQ